ncbi:MAG: hypothetical protein JSV80_01055 [Acidobacteriota bacterium]|nr:MAG: hypothetical protein JSV80_01055 [Acidobacteriota bacterium]
MTSFDSLFFNTSIGARASWRAAVALLALAASASAMAAAPEPEIVYEGSAPGLSPGVLVIRDSRSFDAAIEPLDPDLGGERPDLRKRSILRIVGRERENACRRTLLTEVETSGFNAVVRLEERVPERGCGCAGLSRPPAAWLVSVSRWVRRAEVVASDVVVSCEQPAARPADASPVLLWEASWDHEPGARIVSSAEQYSALIEQAGADADPNEIDFSQSRVVAITGRPRSNSCRKTRIVDTGLEQQTEAVFTLEEIYPATGQMCAQVFMLPRMLVYRVPIGVERARTVTREVR